MKSGKAIGSAKGFVFSLDAFVALSLVLLAIYSLFILVSVPKSYYITFDQTYEIARDTLNSLDHNAYPLVQGQTYLEYIASTKDKVVARQTLDPLIPPQYGYKLEFYDNASGVWQTIYDTSADNSLTHNHDYRKLVVAAQSLVSGYRTPPTVQGSPACDFVQQNVICQANPQSTFANGDVMVGIIRLSLYI